MSVDRLLRRAVKALVLALGVAFVYTSLASSSFFFLFVPSLVQRGEMDLFWSPLARSAVFLVGLTASALLAFAGLQGYKRVWARAAGARSVHLLAMVTGPAVFLVTRIWFLFRELPSVSWFALSTASAGEKQLETLASLAILVVSFVGCLPSLCSPVLVFFALPAQPGSWGRRQVLALVMVILVQAAVSVLSAWLPSLE